MKSSLLKIAMIAALAGMPVCLFAQTGTEPASADAQASPFHSSRPYAIEGVWDENVMLANCDTGVTLASFRALDMFVHGGALTDTNSAPTAVRGPGFGAWWHERGGRFFGASMRIFFYNPDGTFGSVRTISRQIEIGSDPDTFTGTITFQVAPPDGHVLMKGCGTETATRVD